MRKLRKNALLSMAAVAFLAGPAFAQGAKTPKECIDRLNKCADANDVDGMMKAIAEPAASALAKMFKATKALSDSMKELIEAVGGKWGAGMVKELGLNPIPMDLSDMKIEATDIKENGDEAKATGKKDSAGKTETYYFTRTKGTWLLDPMKEEGAADKMQSLDKIAGKINGAAAKFGTLAADIKAGKCANKREATERLTAIGKELSEPEK